MDTPEELTPWMPIDAATLAEAERVALSNLSHNAGFFPKDAHTLANIALHCIREVRATRAENANDIRRYRQLRDDLDLPYIQVWHTRDERSLTGADLDQALDASRPTA